MGIRKIRNYPELLDKCEPIAREIGALNMTRALIAEASEWGSINSIAYHLQCVGKTVNAVQQDLIDRGVPVGHPGQSTAQNPALRNRLLLVAGLELARERGLTNFTRYDAALRAGLGRASVAQRFGGQGKFRQAILEEAGRTDEWLDVLAQGLALKHPAALAAPADRRARAAQALS